MRPTVFQKAELRDENDTIIQQGTYGKGSALSNSTNDAWIDYVMNNLEALYGIAKDEVVPVSALPASGDMNKTYLLTTNGKTYRWSGTAWVELTNSEAVSRAETAANLAEQWATKTDGTVADNEYSAKYYANAAQQSADDAQDVADDMATHLSQIDQNTGGVSANSKRIGNIEKLLQGNLYDYQTDSTSAYIKSVPAGAMPYAGLEKVGGKTIVMNQVFVPFDGVNWGYNRCRGSESDGVNTLTCTSASLNSYSSYTSKNIVNGHKYYFKCDYKYNAPTAPTQFVLPNFHTFNITVPNDTWRTVDYAGTLNSSAINPAVSYASASNVTVGDTFSMKNVVLIDLTLAFGSGNEPTTEECRQIFPAETYTYSLGSLLSAGVTEVVSKDSNNATLQTISIPTVIRNLEGYGWSAGSVSNYIDFERKVFVKRVNRIVLDGTQSIATANYLPLDSSVAWLYNTNVLNPSGKDAPNDNTKTNVVSTKFMAETWNNFQVNNGNFILLMNPNYYSIGIRCTDTSLTTESAINAYMSANPVTVYYEMLTPVEIDISEYLTDDNLIQVESGGTLTFPNSNGDDYQIPVPSEETYMIDLQSAIGG